MILKKFKKLKKNSYLQTCPVYEHKKPQLGYCFFAKDMASFILTDSRILLSEGILCLEIYSSSPFLTSIFGTLYWNAISHCNSRLLLCFDTATLTNEICDAEVSASTF